MELQNKNTMRIQNNDNVETVQIKVELMEELDKDSFDPDVIEILNYYKRTIDSIQNIKNGTIIKNYPIHMNW